MQKRSPNKIFLYSILSLGVYDLVWLSRTRKELIRLTSIPMPRFGWFLSLHILRLLLAIATVVLWLGVYTANQQSVRQTVTPECWSEYVLAIVPETADSHTVSAACKDTVEASRRALNREDTLGKGFAATLVLLLIATVVYPFWLRNYGLAVRRVTDGKMSQAATTVGLMFAPALTMAMLQYLFNTGKVPASANRPLDASEAGHKKLSKVLSVIALVMIILFALFIITLVALVQYASS